jgi:hypothetical protein
MTITRRNVERRHPCLCLKIDVTGRLNELFRDSYMPVCGSAEEWCGSIPRLKINVTTRSKELLRDCRIPTLGRTMKWRVTTLLENVQEGVRSSQVQQLLAFTGGIRSGIYSTCRRIWAQLAGTRDRKLRRKGKTHRKVIPLPEG